MLELAKAVSEFGVLIIIAALFLYFYISDKRSWQKNQEKQFERSNEINDKLTDIIIDNTTRLNEHETILDKHAEDSKDSLNSLNIKVDRIDDKIETLQKTTNELATKEMAEEIKEEVRSLKRTGTN